MGEGVVVIKLVRGDLFSGPEDVKGHQVNTLGVMGQRGVNNVAAQVRYKYPAVYEAYRTLCLEKGTNELLGLCYCVKVKDGWIANLFAQRNIGYSVQYTLYDSLRSSLVQLKGFAKENGLSVALPWGIGCNRGGGSWEVVYKILEEVFDDYDVTLYML